MTGSKKTLKRCAVIGVVGRTNSGKSTLINRVVGEKVSIVSPIVQTTRNTIRAILTMDAVQLVFLDTPGLHKSESKLGTLMNRMARRSSDGVDILAVVFDAARRPRMEDRGWMSRALGVIAQQPVVFVLNKSENAGFNPQPFQQMWNEVTAGQSSNVNPRWIECSARAGEGTDQLLETLRTLAPPSDDFLFPEEIITDYPRKLAFADIIREKYLAKLRDELPHELGVFIDEIHESRNEWEVNATIYVSRNSQKAIVLGPRGALIKWVRTKSVKELSALYDTRIILNLWVKVEKNWYKNIRLLEQMGYAGQM